MVLPFSLKVHLQSLDEVIMIVGPLVIPCNNYVVPFAHTNGHAHSFFPRTISLWNSLPHHITSSPS